MGVEPAHDGRAARLGAHQIPLDIARRQTRHAAHHSHGRGEIGAVALPLGQQEPGYKIHIRGRRLHLQGVGAGILQIIAQRHSLFPRRIAALGSALGDIINLLLHMAGNNRILRLRIGIGRILGVLIAGSQRSHARVGGLHGQILNGIGIPCLQIAAQKHLSTQIEIGVGRALDGQRAQALRHKERAGTVGKHDHARRFFALRRYQRIGSLGQLIAQLPVSARIPAVALGADAVVPCPARIGIQNRAAHVQRFIGFHLHDNMIAGRGFSAQTALALGHPAVRGQAVARALLAEQQRIIQHFAHAISQLRQRGHLGAVRRGQRHGQRAQRRSGSQRRGGHGPALGRIALGIARMRPGIQQQQRRQGGQHIRAGPAQPQQPHAAKQRAHNKHRRVQAVIGRCQRGAQQGAVQRQLQGDRIAIQRQRNARPAQMHRNGIPGVQSTLYPAAAQQIMHAGRRGSQQKRHRKQVFARAQQGKHP